MRMHEMTMTRSTMIAGLGALAATGRTALAADEKPLTTVSFMTTIADDVRAFLYAQSAGYFKQAGLDVAFQNASTGAVVAQAVVGGAVNIGKGSITSLIAAYARGLPFAVIAPGLSYRKEEPTAGYLVKADSPLKTVLDLQGKTVTCSAIGDIAYLGLRALIDKAGGDSSTVKFIEMPFPAVSAAIQTGRVDAGLMGEPAMMQDVKAGKIRYFVDELTGYSRPILEVAYFTTRDWAKKNKEIVSGFSKAVLKGAAYANTHVAETVPLLLPLTKMDPAVAMEMRHGYSATTFDPAAIQPVIDLMAKYKEIPKAFNARELV
jgi:NitT/TauT family transport system substrate-binding protein